MNSRPLLLGEMKGRRNAGLVSFKPLVRTYSSANQYKTLVFYLFYQRIIALQNFIVLNLFIFSWRIMALQYCVDVYHTSTWKSSFFFPKSFCLEAWLQQTISKMLHTFAGWSVCPTSTSSQLRNLWFWEVRRSARVPTVAKWECFMSFRLSLFPLPRGSVGGSTSEGPEEWRLAVGTACLRRTRVFARF